MNSTEYTPAVEIDNEPTGLPPMGALALAGLGALALGAATTRRAHAQGTTLNFERDVPGTGDIKVLNFALVLEDLETEAYVQALQRLTTGGSGGRDAAAGTAITGLGIAAGEPDVTYLRSFGRIERQHRDFLRTALSGSAIAPFKFNFGIPSMTRLQVVNLIYQLELGGVGAYLGAIPFFSTKNFLPVAAGILGTEARHTAIVANVVNRLSGRLVFEVAPQPNQNRGKDTPVPPNDVLRVISPFIAA